MEAPANPLLLVQRRLEHVEEVRVAYLRHLLVVARACGTLQRLSAALAAETAEERADRLEEEHAQADERASAHRLRLQLQELRTAERDRRRVEKAAAGKEHRRKPEEGAGAAPADGAAAAPAAAKGAEENKAKEQKDEDSARPAAVPDAGAPRGTGRRGGSRPVVPDLGAPTAEQLKAAKLDAELRERLAAAVRLARPVCRHSLNVVVQGDGSEHVRLRKRLEKVVLSPLLLFVLSRGVCRTSAGSWHCGRPRPVPSRKSNERN